MVHTEFFGTILASFKKAIAFNWSFTPSVFFLILSSSKHTELCQMLFYILSPKFFYCIYLYVYNCVSVCVHESLCRDIPMPQGICGGQRTTCTNQLFSYFTFFTSSGVFASFEIIMWFLFLILLIYCLISVI